ncbi:hypothetical protein BN8_01540 [Fibrisoma limi BUZ 3]|uniref:Uncharacterized protein n=1 Tax=Fibrisoma limi BUZ 3 TaxID=1185876 RepID=I2GF57_9BACT|nr:hypothetical protein BN8_01540 [Fibrisoma limi BUZ 3]
MDKLYKKPPTVQQPRCYFTIYYSFMSRLKRTAVLYRLDFYPSGHQLRIHYSR